MFKVPAAAIVKGRGRISESRKDIREALAPKAGAITFRLAFTQASHLGGLYRRRLLERRG